MKQLCKILHKETGCKRVRLFLPLSLAERYAVSEEKKAAKKGKSPSSPALASTTSPGTTPLIPQRPEESSGTAPAPIGRPFMTRWSG